MEFLASVNIPLPGITGSIDPVGLILKILILVPLVGGFLLTRESRGKAVFEILAVSLLVLATVVPVSLDQAQLDITWRAFVGRWPLAFFLLGLAFVRDGGFKTIIGGILMALSGYVSIPTQ